MNLNDLEGHLNALKEMFIQKQKMMDELEKVTDAPPAGIWKKTKKRFVLSTFQALKT